MKRWLAGLILAWALPAGAIIGGLGEAEEADSPARRVDADDCHSPFAGVVALQIGQGVYSGVLVAPRWVLTAAHVAASRRKDPAAIAVRFSCRGHTLAVSRVVPHPTYTGYRADRVNFNDLALLELEQDAPVGTPVYPLFARTPRAGTVLTLVGFGAAGSADGRNSLPAQASVRRVGENAADLLLPPARGLPAAAYIWDFDGPDAAGSLFGGPSLGNQREATVGSGDSGSAALLRDGDAWALVGINTFQIQIPVKPPKFSAPPPRFGSGGGGMLVAAYADWLHQVIAAPP